MAVIFDPVLGELRTKDTSSGGGMSIGGAVTSGTSGSVPYIDVGGNLAQNNANFFWDATNHRLGIGTTTPQDNLEIYGGGIYNGDASSRTWTGASGGTNYIESGTANFGANAPLLLTGANNALGSTLTANFATSLFNGKVGINAPTPGGTLEVDGTTFLKGGIDVGDTAYYDSTVAMSIKSSRLWLFNMYNASVAPLMFLGQNGHLSLKTFTTGTNATLTVNDPNTVDNLAAAQISIDAAGHKGLVITGLGTGNIQEWQNSSGTPLSKVNSDGVILPVQAATASAPTYVKGGMYFDTTLNKLMIGGATAWETVTST